MFGRSGENKWFLGFSLSDFWGKIGKQEKRGISVLLSTTKDEMAG